MCERESEYFLTAKALLRRYARFYTHMISPKHLVGMRAALHCRHPPPTSTSTHTWLSTPPSYSSPPLPHHHPTTIKSAGLSSSQHMGAAEKTLFLRLQQTKGEIRAAFADDFDIPLVCV